MSGTFRSLRVRNYRLFWTGQLISLVGTWMQTVAQGWLVLQLTNDPFARFQSDVAVYHDDVSDFSTNESIIDGTVALQHLLALWK